MKYIRQSSHSSSNDKGPTCLRQRRNTGNSLIGLMVAMVIILVLVVVFLVGGQKGMFGMRAKTPPRKDNLGKTLPGAVRYAAEDTVCRNNLNQIRESIQVYETSNDGPPPSLNALHLPAQMLCDPIDHRPYVYDPTTGKVHCTHPGHENF